MLNLVRSDQPNGRDGGHADWQSCSEVPHNGKQKMLRNHSGLKDTKGNYRILPCIMRTHVQYAPSFWPQTFRKKSVILIFQFNFLFIHKFNKTDYHIPGDYSAHRNRSCFLELHFSCVRINRRIKNICLDTELVLPMYNAHPYFPLKFWAQMCTLYMANYGTCYLYC